MFISDRLQCHYGHLNIGFSFVSVPDKVFVFTFHNIQVLQLKLYQLVLENRS